MAIVLTGTDEKYIYYQENNAVNGETAYIKQDRKTKELNIDTARNRAWENYSNTLGDRMPK